MSTRDTAWPAGSAAWVELSTDDLRTARRAYAHLFGWDTEDGPAEDNGYVICLKNGRAAAGMLTPEQDVPNAWLVYLASDDVDATLARAQAAGGTVVVEATDVGDGTGRFAVAQDPTGAVFGVWQAGTLTGLQIVDEPGTFVWTTLLTRDLPAAQRFYAEVFDYAYEERTPDLVAVHAPDGALVASMHQAEQLPDDAPPAWNVHLAVASRDSTVSLAEMERGFEVLMTFETPFGAEAVIRGPGGETFNVTETPD